ncbi:MAG: hypothetical protein AB7F35_00625 [Acetobacteraceae bacterium]
MIVTLLQSGLFAHEGIHVTRYRAGDLHILGREYGQELIALGWAAESGHAEDSIEWQEYLDLVRWHEDDPEDFWDSFSHLDDDDPHPLIQRKEALLKLAQS